MTIVSVAVVHHMEMPAALERMRELVRPGGVVAIVGLARSTRPIDFVCDLGGAVETRVRKRRHGGYWETPAPKVWPPPHSYRDAKTIAADALPDARYRRHAMFRYSIVWTKPAGVTEMRA